MHSNSCKTFDVESRSDPCALGSEHTDMSKSGSQSTEVTDGRDDAYTDDWDESEPTSTNVNYPSQQQSSQRYVTHSHGLVLVFHGVYIYTHTISRW